MSAVPTRPVYFARTTPPPSTTKIHGILTAGQVASPRPQARARSLIGGSVLAYEGGRLQVGPRSAGSKPGPACYRLGGPLTVTDVQVLLGRIRPGHFPAIFGPDGNQVLDAPGRKLPRPDLLRRAYMLGPLAEIAPQLVHPTARKTIGELWAAFERSAHPLQEVPLDLSASHPSR